jgi:uncharacterized protein (DUF1499 family)
MNQKEVILSTKNQINLLKKVLLSLPSNHRVRVQTEYLIYLSEQLMIELEK